MESIGAVGMIFSVLYLILAICIIAAIFNISGATQRTAKATQAAEHHLKSLSYKMTLALKHVNVEVPDDASALEEMEPPCKQCLKKGAVVQLERKGNVLKCPACGATRK